jgi:hypothetical protein
MKRKTTKREPVVVDASLIRHRERGTEAREKIVEQKAVVKAEPRAPIQVNADIISSLVLNGDLRAMKPEQKVEYYNRFCSALGLNPLTRPFQLIVLNQKETLYATRDCAEQLRKINGVAIVDMQSSLVGDVYTVRVKAQDTTGRFDMATGAVNVKGLQGDALANAMMKAETKAKRRATLSICGLGILDETEVEAIHPAMKNASIDPPPKTADDVPHANAYDQPPAGDYPLFDVAVCGIAKSKALGQRWDSLPTPDLISALQFLDRHADVPHRDEVTGEIETILARREEDEQAAQAAKEV